MILSGLLRKLRNMLADIRLVPLIIVAVLPSVIPVMHNGVTMLLRAFRLKTVNAGLLSISPVQITIDASPMAKIKAEIYGNIL